MGRHILVSDPDPHGESQHVCYCDEHLAAALKIAPLSLGEYVLPADDDCDCEECDTKGGATN